MLDLKQGIQQLKDEMNKNDFADQPSHFLDVFDQIFKAKMKKYLEKEKRLFFQSEEESDQNLFNFAKNRIKEIENWVKLCYEAEKQIEQARVTKLNNEAAGKNMASIQKELLEGRYKIKLKEDMPYN